MRKKAGKRGDRVDLAGSEGWGGPVRMRTGRGRDWDWEGPGKKEMAMVR